MKGEPLITIEEWCLVDAKQVDDKIKDLNGAKKFVSFMRHDCDSLRFEYVDEEKNGESEVRYLDDEDSVVGKCWYCMEKAPVDLHGIWMIHNMDIVHEIPDPFNDSWEPKYIESRLADIENSKKKARKNRGYDG